MIYFIFTHFFYKILLFSYNDTLGNVGDLFNAYTYFFISFLYYLT